MFGEIFVNFFASISAGSFVRLNRGECCNFFDCFAMTSISSFFEWPQTLHHMLATPSRNFLPLESTSQTPSPLTILLNSTHSFI